MTSQQAYPGGHFLASMRSDFRPSPSTSDDDAAGSPSSAAGAVVSPATAPLFEVARMNAETLKYLAELLAA